MAIRGKRAKAEPKTKVGQIVGFKVDDDTVVAEVIAVESIDSIKVRCVDGREFECEESEFKTPMCSVEGCGGEATQRDGLCDECRETLVYTEEDTGVDAESFDEEESGKIHFTAIAWDNAKINFKVLTKTEGLKFYGWWRISMKSKENTHYAVDIFAQKAGRAFTIDSLHYSGDDPRLKMSTLNADISARCQQWLFHNFNDGTESFDALLKRADKPMINIDRLNTLDLMIAQLQEFRRTAIVCGGTRHFEIRGNDKNPPVLVTINITPQAIALNGKVPSLHMGAVVDAVVKDGEKGTIRNPIRVDSYKLSADPANIESLHKQLKIAKQGGDEKAQRDIRATLRKLGIKGGLRSLEKAAANNVAK
jgi:hypothetical protein